jgi:hypothetical protein
VTFQTYDAFSPDCKIVEEKECIAWLKTQKNLAGLQEKFKTIYQEFRLMSGLSEQQYAAIGTKQSLFSTSLETQKLLWSVFVKYKQFLLESQQFDLALCEIEHLPEFDVLIVDEAQDFSTLQLSTLMRMCPTKQIACFMDSNQSLADPLSKMNYLKSILSISDDSMIRLPLCHRCSQQVIQLANNILAMKHFVTGGLSEKGGEISIPIRDEHRFGRIVWEEPNQAYLNSLITQVNYSKLKHLSFQSCNHDFLF